MRMFEKMKMTTKSSGWKILPIQSAKQKFVRNKVFSIKYNDIKSHIEIVWLPEIPQTVGRSHTDPTECVKLNCQIVLVF